jgi:hypothetical protein
MRIASASLASFSTFVRAIVPGAVRPIAAAMRPSKRAATRALSTLAAISSPNARSMRSAAA